MEEETLRKMAVQQYLQGKTPISIYREMGRSKKGVYKWLGRYQSGDAHWCQDKPKTPHGHPHETPPEMQKPVKNIRIQREESPYAQIGTSAITWEFKQLGITPPSDRTINWVLKREGLVKKNSLYPQRSGIPLLQKAPGDLRHPWAKIHHKRWTFLFAQCHGSLESPSLSSPPTKKRRPRRGSGLDQMLEDYGHARLSLSRQPTLFSRKQSLPSFLRHCPQSLSFAGDQNGLHSDRRTLE